MDKGIIVSIQGYSENTTQELANTAISAGAVAIRTDQPIKIKKNVIGLEKDKSYTNYITPTREAVIRLQGWADYIAIDSRKNNTNLELLYAHCHINNKKIIADIKDVEDVKNIEKICKEQNIKYPAYYATTFCFDKENNEKLKIIRDIQNITNIPVIAEGGYDDLLQVKLAFCQVDYVCIGTAISDIEKLTKKYMEAVC